MKYFLFFLAAAFSNATFSQTPFEGTIKYRVQTSFVFHGSEEKNESYLFVHFGINKMKIQFVEPSKNGKKSTYKLVYLDSGKVFTVYPETHTYTYQRLSQRKPDVEVPASRTIAGYKTHSSSINEIDISGELSALLSSKTVFYVAENLTYPIPEKYAGNAELLVVQNGKIVLGSDFYFSYNTFDFQVDEEEDKKINQSNFAIIEAQEILEKSIDPNEFLIPKDYKIRSRYDYGLNDSTTQIDSAFTFTDSTAENSKKTSVTKPKQKRKSKGTSSKQNAARRNDE